MLKALTIFCIGVPILSGCLTMEPITFNSEHPANAHASHGSEPSDTSVIKDYTPRPPHHPLDENDRAVEATGERNPGSMKDMPGMDHGDKEAAPARSEPAPNASAQMYTCPMHPKVIQDHEGRCPICEMRLIPQKDVGATAAEGEKQ